jgi:regulatory protein
MRCLKTKRTAYQTALGLLARREHSVKQLMQKLSLRGFAKEEIRQTLDDLIASGYLSNLRFAECYTRSRIEKGFGPVRIAIELFDRGIDDELAQQVLLEYQHTWMELAQKAYIKRFGHIKSVDIQEKAKRQQFMLYRGFTISVQELESTLGI